MNNKIFDEQSRLTPPYGAGVAGTPPEQRFDKFARLATAALAAPIALVTIVDSERRCFESRQGLGAGQSAGSLAFCSHAIAADDTFIVNDVLRDARFANHALVVDAPAIRFYAGHPIKTPDGVAVGTLCIFDTRVRTLSGEQVAMLRWLAQLAGDELSKELVMAAQERAEAALQQQNEALGREIKQRCDIEMTLRRSDERLRSMAEAQHQLGQHQQLRDAAPATAALRASEMRRMQGEERLKTITDNVPVLISYLDSELRFQFANAMYKDWLGVRSEDMIGKSVSQVFGAIGYDEQAGSLSRALGGHMSNVELTVHRKGRTRILSTTYMPHVSDGKTIGIYVLATDATAARAHERQLLLQVSEDPLTQLPNRRMHEFQLAKSLATARRNATRLALMYLDLDDFKRINDSLGHGGGDEVLVEFGRRVSSVLRESDLLARLAGDAFGIILEAVGSGAACELVARKILGVLRQPFVVAGREISVSASIGVAFGCDGVSAEALADHADQALHAAKRAGVNQFAVVSMHRGPDLYHG